MKNRWLNLLFIFLCVLIAGLSWHLFTVARGTEAASLIINILKQLNILLFLLLFYILLRNLVKLFVGARGKKPGFRLQTKLVLGMLPLTLAPAVILLFLATRFVDDILGDLVVDSNKSDIIEHSDELRTDYLEQIGELYGYHGKPLLDLIREGDIESIPDYLARFGIQGVEYYRDDLLLARYLSPDFPSNRVIRLQDSTSANPDQEPIIFDDGFLVARFPYRDNLDTLAFIFTRETPFSERFLFIRESYTFLKHTKRKTERVIGLNKDILVVATVSILFMGVWTGLAFARRFLGAFSVLISGAEQVSRGNFDTQLDLKTGDELEDVVHAFNSMTRTLKSNQTELEQKAHDLETVNAEFADQIEYSQTILHQIKTGILSTDRDGRVKSYNPAAQIILGLQEIPGNADFASLLDPDKHRLLLDLWRDFRQEQGPGLFREIELGAAGGDLTQYAACGMVPLKKDGTPFGCLIVLDDLTQLFQAQKLAAWQEVARRIAHEIKNPLTPIQLSIQRIRRKAEKGSPDLNAAIESAHETIMSETSILKNLVDEFSTFAKMPAPVKTLTDLTDLVAAVCESYQPVFPQLTITAEKLERPVVVACDPSQIRQVLSNLIHNAADASKPGDAITVHIRQSETEVVLEVADEGSGILESDHEKVFAPYYSKSPKGTGLGLAIVKRIVQDHNGQVRIETNQPTGARFLVSLPAERRGEQEAADPNYQSSDAPESTLEDRRNASG